MLPHLVVFHNAVEDAFGTVGAADDFSALNYNVTALISIQWIPFVIEALKVPYPLGSCWALKIHFMVRYRTYNRKSAASIFRQKKARSVERAFAKRSNSPVAVPGMRLLCHLHRHLIDQGWLLAGNYQ